MGGGALEAIVDCFPEFVVKSFAIEDQLGLARYEIAGSKCCVKFASGNS